MRALAFQGFLTSSRRGSLGTRYTAGTPPVHQKGGDLMALRMLLPLLLALTATAAAAGGDGVAAQAWGSSSSSSSSSDCEALGFTGLGLCSDCEQMASYVKDAKLVEECRQCCVKDEGDAGGPKFTEAVLEVCGQRVKLYSDVKAFIDDSAAKFPALKISYRLGAAPKLIMKEAGTGEQEVIRIDNWKAENVEQFLQEKLVS